MRFSVAVLLALLLATILGAQAPATPQQPTFTRAINYVRVDAYPTVDGRPVPDLTKADFEILEDGAPQVVDSFEHIIVRPRDITAERVEPHTVREANDMAADARNRLFVLFLDTYHVTDETASHNGRVRAQGSPATRRPPDAKPLGPSRVDRALMNFLDRGVGPTDLFAAFTPEMDPSDITFTRRPESFDALVRTMWARRFSWDNMDPEEERWALCYPPDETVDPFRCYAGVFEEMVLRRREGLTLDAAHRLVRRLGELREERKAVVLVSEGWALYRQNMQLARPLPMVPNKGCPVTIPEGRGVYVGSDGKPHMGSDPRVNPDVDWQQCESARVMLANADDNRTYRTLLDAANRSNTSFYPVDPRGLAVFDTPIDASSPGNVATLGAGSRPLTAETAGLRSRLESLRNLATATDGRMTENNDLAGGLKKIGDDRSDYYLLGYYSTNAKTDGTFRRITVRVKRPGVSVRARRGYLAPTEAAMAASRAAATPMDPEVVAREGALATLGTIRADRPFHVAAGVAWRASEPSSPLRPTLWIEGELDVSAAREMAWSAGADASISVLGSGDQPIATDIAQVNSAARSFLRQVAPDVAAGSYVVRVRVQGKAGGGADAGEQVRVTVPAVRPVLGQALLFRRGPYSGPGFQPAADLRFRRAERVRVDVPLGAPADSVSARLLDVKGNPLSVPVTAGIREQDGVRLASAEVGLAPLTNGDYLIEVAAKAGDRREKALAAFRIVP